MSVKTHQSYREWSRYQWASETDPTPAEPDVPRWNLVEWVGDQGGARPHQPLQAADMFEGDTALSGFRHNPGGGSRWAEGYRHNR